MSKVNFNVNAYTARLIGRENVATLNGAILELVKNTYDADASICILYYDDIDQCVYLMDNGCGMNKEVILKNWMTIGNSSKKKNYVSNKGRIQTGAKGIGRFALDRLADVCTMLTINKKNNLLWKVDWRDFNDETNITEISADLDLVEMKPQDFLSGIHNKNVLKLVNKNFSTCTLFKVSNMRDLWSDKQLDSIRNNLRSLIPMEISKIFKIYIFNNLNTIEQAEILTDNNDFTYDYKIDFEVKEDKGFIKINRNEFDLLDQLDNINKVLIEHDIEPFTDEDKKLFSGVEKEYVLSTAELTKNLIDRFLDSFDGTFYFSKIIVDKKREKQYFYKNRSPKKINDIFSGIKIYRDCFRVRPYGEFGTSNFDWLLLDSLKSQSPAAITGKGRWKVRSGQMFGSVNISRSNINLLDQSNREGIVETQEFKALREALTKIIYLFETDRQYVFRKLRSYNEIIDESERIEKEINEKAKKEAEIRKNNSNKLSKIDKENEVKSNYISAIDVKKVLDRKDDEIRNLEQEKNLLMILATTGIVTNTYIHEFKAQTQLLNNNVRTALVALRKNDFDICENALERAHEIRKSLNSWFEVTINAVSKDRRKRRTVDIVDYLKNYLKSWSGLLKNIDIKIGMDAEEKCIKFLCFPYEIDTILSNLITNSITSFAKDDRLDKEITINLSKENNELCIYYTDNGMGLSNAYRNNPDLILEQFESDRKNELGELNGTGMGMYILKTIVDTYNGVVDLDENRRLEKGFRVRILLKGVK